MPDLKPETTGEELAKNAMKEVIMTTPAISDGAIVVRTLGHVVGTGSDQGYGVIGL